jgi:hypothetical protein
MKLFGPVKSETNRAYRSAALPLMPVRTNTRPVPINRIGIQKVNPESEDSGPLALGAEGFGGAVELGAAPPKIAFWYAGNCPLIVTKTKKPRNKNAAIQEV